MSFFRARNAEEGSQEDEDYWQCNDLLIIRWGPTKYIKYIVNLDKDMDADKQGQKESEPLAFI